MFFFKRSFLQMQKLHIFVIREPYILNSFYFPVHARICKRLLFTPQDKDKKILLVTVHYITKKLFRQAKNRLFYLFCYLYMESICFFTVKLFKKL